MILTCPDCSTRYSVDDSVIVPNGRTVRCANCGASWFVSADPDLMSLHEQASEPELKPVPKQDAGLIAPDNTEALADNQPKNSAANIGAHVHMRDKADSKKHNRRLAGVFAIWALALAIILAAGIIAVQYRQDVVNKMPNTASIYKAFGLSVTYSGLDFEPPQSRTIIIDGQPTLIVNGYVINRASKVQPLPMIELSLTNKGEEVLARWAVQLSKEELAPKERLAYESSYPNPPIDATSLEYRFLDENGSEADLVPAPIVSIPDP